MKIFKSLKIESKMKQIYSHIRLVAYSHRQELFQVILKYRNLNVHSYWYIRKKELKKKKFKNKKHFLCSHC